MMMYIGAALVLRRKFSAKHFMSDIREYRCTVFQVRIGPLGRNEQDATVDGRRSTV